jgi:hypothetical protein
VFGGVYSWTYVGGTLRTRTVLNINLLKPSVFLSTTSLNIPNFYMVLALR